MGNGIHEYTMYDLSGELSDTDHYLMVTKVRERLEVNK